jgi:hypothetical protein
MGVLESRRIGAYERTHLGKHNKRQRKEKRFPSMNSSSPELAPHMGQVSEPLSGKEFADAET